MFPQSLVVDGLPKCGVLEYSRTVMSAYGGAKLTQGSHSHEKFLNFRGSPWKVLEFSTVKCSGLESDFCTFWLSKTEYKSQFREFKGHLHKVLYVLCNNINCQEFKTSEMKNVEKLVKQTVQALKTY